MQVLQLLHAHRGALEKEHLAFMMRLRVHMPILYLYFYKTYIACRGALERGHIAFIMRDVKRHMFDMGGKGLAFLMALLVRQVRVLM